jgi:hypothetical protein
MSFAGKWMEFEIVVVQEISQKAYAFCHMHNPD